MRLKQPTNFSEEAEIKVNNNLDTGELILYQSEDGLAQISLTAIAGTVWLTQEELAELFDKGRSTIAEHIQNILADGELIEDSVCRNFRRTAKLAGPGTNARITLCL